MSRTQPKTVSRKGRDRGFTLLEVLLATLVLSLGVVALLWAFNAGIFASTDAENMAVALNIGQENMEAVKNTPFADLADSGPAPDPVFTNFNVTVDVAEGQNPKQVDVTVDWNTKGGKTGFTLTTMAADYSTV